MESRRRAIGPHEWACRVACCGRESVASVTFAVGPGAATKWIPSPAPAQSSQPLAPQSQPSPSTSDTKPLFVSAHTKYINLERVKNYIPRSSSRSKRLIRSSASRKISSKFHHRTESIQISNRSIGASYGTGIRHIG